MPAVRVHGSLFGVQQSAFDTDGRRPNSQIQTPSAVRAPVQGSDLTFALFVLLNFVLYVRPNELIPAIYGFEIYLVVMICCLVAAFSVVLAQLWPWNMDNLTACVAGFTGAIFLSHFSRFRVEEAMVAAIDFFKVLLYYGLFIGLVTNVSRLQRFVFWLTLFITICSAASVLEYYGLITLPVAAKIADGNYLRLRGSGIFADPNDLCVLLCLGLIFGLYLLSKKTAGFFRFLWLGPMALLFYALLLTQSRGGLLALMCGLVAMLRAKWGWKTAIGLGFAILPVLIVVAGERQSAISTSTDTGNLRVELWSDGLMFVRTSPLFGIGRDEYSKQAGQVAHNSYLHAFGETGLIGGALFLGAFVFALMSLERLCPGGKRGNVLLDPDLKQLQPYILGGLVSYMAGMMTLTLTYLIPTFTVLAMAAVFLRMAAADIAAQPAVGRQGIGGGAAQPVIFSLRFDLHFLGRTLLATVAFLAMMMMFVRFARV